MCHLVAVFEPQGCLLVLQELWNREATVHTDFPLASDWIEIVLTTYRK